MAEFGFSAKVGADVSGFQKGMQKAEKSLKKFADGINNLGKKGIVGSLANVSLAMGGVVTAFKTATKVVKDVAKAVGECTEAYKTQALAERALETAIQNNPYISGDSLNALKQFASEMQKVSNYGDEQIIALETQLVSLGRTEEETMQIIKVATDMASTGTVSLDTAITQLNATLNGNIGRLGQQNAELKGLTEEELKAGKAIEILGEKFKGLSSATIDTSKQLQNVKSDFKEAIGQFTLPTSDMWNKFWAGFYEKGIAVLNQFNDYLDRVIVGEVMSEKIVDVVKSIKDEREKILYIEDEVHTMTEKQLNILLDYYKNQKHLSDNEEKVFDILQREVIVRENLSKLYAEMDAEEADRLKAEEEQRKEEEEIVKLKEEYLEKIAEQKAKWKNIEKVTGEAVKTEEKITFYQNSLVDLMTQAGGKITENNQLYKDQMKIISDLEKSLSPEAKEKSDVWRKKLIEQRIEMLEKERDLVVQRLEDEEATDKEIYEEKKYFSLQIIELKKQQIDEEMELELSKVANYENAEEEMLRIKEYYQNKKMAMIQDESVGYNEVNADVIAGTTTTWDNIKGIISENGDAIKAILKQFGKEAVETFKKVASAVKKIVKDIISAFKKIFKFDTSDALDSLLAFEDSILTFFVETLPKLPQFFASAMQSISVLLQNLDFVITEEKISQIITDIVEAITSSFPQVVEAGTRVVINLVKGIVTGIVKNKDKIINALKTVLNAVLTLIKEIFPQIIRLIVEFLPDIIKMLVEFLPQFIDAFVQILLVIADNLPVIIPAIVEQIPAIISAVIVAVLENLPKLIWATVKGLVNGFRKVNWWKVVKDIFNGFINGVKKLFGIHSPSTLFEGFGLDMVKGLLNGLAGVGQMMLNIFESAFNMLKSFFSNITSWFEDAFSSVGSGIKNAWEWMTDTASDIGSTIWEGLEDAGSAIWSGAKKVGEWIGSWFATGTNNAPKGLAVVGEAGPELVNFKGGEKVYNNTNTQKILQGAGNGDNVFNVTFNNTVDTTAFTMMKQLKQYQRNLAFNGVL